MIISKATYENLKDVTQLEIYCEISIQLRNWNLS